MDDFIGLNWCRGASSLRVSRTNDISADAQHSLDWLISPLNEWIVQKYNFWICAHCSPVFYSLRAIKIGAKKYKNDIRPKNFVVLFNDMRVNMNSHPLNPLVGIFEWNRANTSYCLQIAIRYIIIMVLIVHIHVHRQSTACRLRDSLSLIHAEGVYVREPRDICQTNGDFYK